MSEANKGPGIMAGLGSFLSNPAVQWVGAAVVAYIVLRFAVPDLAARARKGFNTVVDDTLGAVADITGRPETQVPAGRRWYDSVRGLWVEGDRALSDLID
jgi:hypothetical protein